MESAILRRETVMQESLPVRPNRQVALSGAPTEQFFVLCHNLLIYCELRRSRLNSLPRCRRCRNPKDPQRHTATSRICQLSVGRLAQRDKQTNLRLIEADGRLDRREPSRHE